VIEKLAIDAESGWLYFLASPDDAVRQYLYRSDWMDRVCRSA